MLVVNAVMAILFAGGSYLFRTPWMSNGYCSRLCDPNASPADDDQSAAESRSHSAVIGVTCGNGHEFDVLRSFIGMRRSCPECGAKTPVIES